MTRTLPLPPLQAEATAGLATDLGIIHAGESHGRGQCDPPNSYRHQNHSGIHRARRSVGHVAGQAEGETYAPSCSGFIAYVMSSQR